MKIKNKNGFTLFELLVSISIIGIMVALAVVSYSSAQKKARDSRRIQDMQSVQKAAEMYYSQNNYAYPANTTTPWTVGGETILASYPTDPKGIAYPSPTMSTTAYCICAFMEEGKGNSTSNACAFASSGTLNWYCVKNQQ